MSSLDFGTGNNHTVKKQRQSYRGYYKLGFVEPYNGVSERDVEIRQEYAKDLISKYTGIPKNMIQFRKKSTNQTIVSLDEVFYVKTGKEILGKMSIRVQRMFTSVNLTFIYQEKKLKDGSTYTRDKQGTFKRKTKSSQRKRNRKSKQQNDSRRF